MLKQVECREAPHLSAQQSDRTGPRHGTVWVYSKGQSPYEFCPSRDPCSPNEWPYNLQALRGTPDHEDILAWHLGRYHEFSRVELEALMQLLIRHVGDRQISVAVYHDVDTGRRHLWFTVWGFSMDRWSEASTLIQRFEDDWASNRALSQLFWVVDVTASPGRFEARDHAAASVQA